MFNPKISIIIPVYNWVNYVWEAIESALNQTYTNIEVLVINDGSNDDWETDKLLKSYWDKIIYIHKENWGVASALNLWIEKMTWEYFSWLSHDDLYMENKLEEQVKFLWTLDNIENIILFSNYIFINEDWKEINKIEITYKPENILYKLFINSFLNWCTLLIPKKAFKEIWVFENELKTTQDYHLWFRMMKKYKFVNVPQYLVKSRQHWEQDSKTKIFKAIVERKELESFIFRVYSIKELKKSAWSKLPNFLFFIITKIKLEKYRVLWFLYLIAQKLYIDIFLANLYRKIFKY
jgi:glycosyltransferase involved in cell wall biosynthesis